MSDSDRPLSPTSAGTDTSHLLDGDRVLWEAPNGDHIARRASQRSYAAASAKDRQGWLSLYADDAVVADPVGPSFFDAEGEGHHGKEAVAAFWDSAIAPVQRFRFHIKDSHACGHEVANVGTISTWFSNGTRVDTDLVMIYTVDPDSGLIASMRAYWEADRAMATARSDEA